MRKYLAHTLLFSALAVLVIGINTAPAYAAVGDVVASFNVNSFMPTAACCSPGFFQGGIAFDGTSLYLDRFLDRDIYEVNPLTGGLIGTFDWAGPAGQFPNAMGFDAKRNGLWIGPSACTDEDGAGPLNDIAIYFHDFDTGVTTNEFDILSSLVNPATGSDFIGLCFIDGLAYNEGNIGTDADDEIWFSDDVNTNMGKFRPDGTLVTGYNTCVEVVGLCVGGAPSGIAIAGSNVYLGNDGGSDVFRASDTTPLVIDPVFGMFASVDNRVEDLECDPVTFSVEVIWVRSSPQGLAADNDVTAFEIEANSCSFLKPVGGMLLPIDTAALLIAGMQSSMIWILPVMGATASGIAGLYLAKAKYHKTEE